MRNISIGLKLMLGFSTMALVVALVAAVAWHTLGREHANYEQFAGRVSLRLHWANELLDAAQARAIGARNLVLLPDGAELETERQAVLRAHEKVAQSLAQLEKLASAPGGSDAEGGGEGERERALLADVRGTEARYGPLALAIAQLAQDGRHEEAVTRMNRECRPLLAALVRSVEAYRAHGAAQAAAEAGRAAAAYAFSRRLLLGVGIAAVLLAVGLALCITPSITQPIGQAVRVARSVAAGDLTLRIESHGRDEAAMLLQALATMRHNLERIVGEVRGDAEAVASATAQIAQGNLDLSQRTEQQAAALQQTAASMDQLGSTVRHNAANAGQADRLAQGASAVAASGGEAVARVVRTMEGIEQSSRRIADVIRVVDELAFQTNLLALNAAVEAARAGEQGRGFAVVAGEVRALAQRSAEAAREIKALIDDSVERVGQGATQAHAAGATMVEVVQSIRRVTDLLGELSSASDEQSRGVAQVGEAVNQMDRVTQQNAALVEESAAAAESLRTQAQRLVQAVAVFRVAPDAAQAPC